MKYQLTKENRFHKIVRISKSSLNLRRFVNIKRQTNIFCNVSIVHEYVIPIATGETGVDGLAKSSTDRLISRHIPGIGQNDFLACTSGRCAFALLHSHQVADVGQHRLEVRHFPRWSLNFWTWKTAHPGAVSSSTLGSLAGCVVLTVATPGTMRPTPTFWSNDRRAPMFARLTASFRICARFPAREPRFFELNARLTTLPRNTTHSPAQLFTVHAGDITSIFNIFVPNILTDENERKTCKLTRICTRSFTTDTHKLIRRIYSLPTDSYRARKPRARAHLCADWRIPLFVAHSTSFSHT